jgi:hypothetical protein
MGVKRGRPAAHGLGWPSARRLCTLALPVPTLRVRIITEYWVRNTEYWEAQPDGWETRSAGSATCEPISFGPSLAG